MTLRDSSPHSGTAFAGAPVEGACECFSGSREIWIGLGLPGNLRAVRFRASLPEMTIIFEKWFRGVLVPGEWAASD